MGTPLILIIAAVAIIGYVISVYNGLQSLKVKIDEAWSQIDVQLKRRVDLIPNIVETVKGYATHEKEVFQNVTEARSALMGAQGTKATAEADKMLTGALGRLLAVAEAYPELKAQDGFLNLQRELSDTEDKVAYSRQFFNSIIKDFNQKIVMFPSNILAGMFGFKEKEFFEVAEGERAAVKVDFGSSK